MKFNSTQATTATAATRSSASTATTRSAGPGTRPECPRHDEYGCQATNDDEWGRPCLAPGVLENCYGTEACGPGPNAPAGGGGGGGSKKKKKSKPAQPKASLFSRTYKARARRERIRARASRVAASLLPTVGLLVAVLAVYAVVHVLAARRRRRERVAATEFKAKVAPYLVEAPEL